MVNHVRFPKGVIVKSRKIAKIITAGIKILSV
jgi:hypothetical protein